MAVDRSIRVLVADNNPSMRRITTSMLKDLGFTNVVEVFDGNAALDKIVNDNIDLVISEWNLPVIPGIQLLRKLRDEPAFERLPFVMLTSEASQESILQAAQSGVSAYLVRPLAGAKLGQKLDEILRNQDRDEAAAPLQPGEPDQPEQLVPADEEQPVPGDDHGRILHIVENRHILTYFHPLISVRDKGIIGFEAFCRGYLQSPSEILMPDVLFESAAKAGLSERLDRICRETALENFKPLYDRNDRLLLSINIDGASISGGQVDLGNMTEVLAGLGINPHNIILDIQEPEIEDTDHLTRFVASQRERGYLIAFDRVGKGRIHFETIAALKPDIIKIDRMVVKNIDQEYFQQETMKAVVALAAKVGAVVMATGVETVGEIMAVLGAGVDIMQGYYFSRPAEGKNVIQHFQARIEAVSAAFLDHSMKRIVRHRTSQAGMFEAIDGLAATLAGYDSREFDGPLEAFLRLRAEMDAVYVLDGSGTQATMGFHSLVNVPPNRRLICSPHVKGESHSHRAYYLHVMAGFERFVTDVFASRTSGRLCRTVARAIKDASGAQLVLCVDVEAGAGL